MSDMPQLFRSSFVKANKNHICCECKGVIEKGERYFAMSGLWEGKYSNFKVCHDCEDLRSEYRNSYDETVPYEYLKEYVLDSDNEEWIKEFKTVQEERSPKRCH